MALYAAIFSYIDDQERIAEVRPAHRAYLQQLLDAGTLHEAGRFGDERGGMIVYNTASEAEARNLLARDPFTTEGVITDATVREWKVIFSAPNAAE